MIYVSTAGYKHLDGVSSALKLANVGIQNVELSAGKIDKNIVSKLLAIGPKFNLQLHNYFPPPTQPFVLNLASENKIIAKLSMEHVLNCLNLCERLGLDTYSVHGGFLLDPNVSELGSRITSKKIMDREQALLRFVARLNELDDIAGPLGIRLLVENNVISKNNFDHFDCDPFLMTDADECLFVMRNTSSNVRLLIDVAHLKVSSNVLNFCRVEFLERCHSDISAYHLSDNCGERDSNQEFDEKSWFWSLLKRDLDYYSVEVASCDGKKLLDQVRLAEKMLGYRNG